MASPQPPPHPASSPPSSGQDPTTPVADAKYYGTPAILHYSAIGVSILGPIALLLPSTRTGATSRIQNIILGSGAFWGLNQLAYDYTGKSIVARSNERWGKILSAADTLPTEKAQQTKALLAAQKARREEAEAEKRGLLKQVWMGDEKEDWKKRRIEEDRKALASGKGYGDLIMDQIWEVWNQSTGKKSTQEREQESSGAKEDIKEVKKEAAPRPGEKSS